MNNELLLNDYNTVSVGKSYGKFLGDNYDISFAKEKVEDFKNLYNNLEEYSNYSKFNYVLDDVKKKFQDKTKQDDKIKSINDEIEKLIKSLEKSYNSLNTETGFLFFKHKADPDKAHLEINTSMEELDKKFDEYDNISIDNQLKTKLNETSTIFDALWFVLSF
jgi:predicted nuclease with TOPRIM domain